MSVVPVGDYGSFYLRIPILRFVCPYLEFLYYENRNFNFSLEKYRKRDHIGLGNWQ